MFALLAGVNYGLTALASACIVDLFKKGYKWWQRVIIFSLSCLLIACVFTLTGKGMDILYEDGYHQGYSDAISYASKLMKKEIE